MQLSTLEWIILMTLINGLLAFAGAFFFFVKKSTEEKIILYLVAFTTGTLLGGVFFHLLPEAFKKLNFLSLILLTALGFLIFMLMEKFIHWRHCHKKECGVHPVTYLILYGDAMHNFLDGLIIASSFLISIPAGILTSILVIAHEFPQEIGDFAVLIYGGFKKNKALFFNLFAQLTSVFGGIAGFYFLSIYKYETYLLPFAAGGFLYISLMDLFPEIFREKSIVKIIKNLLAIILGILLLISAKYLAG
jgi:zinc and cadmium transporter